MLRAKTLFAIVALVLLAAFAANSAMAAEEHPVGLPDLATLQAALKGNAIAEAKKLAKTATTTAGVKRQKAKMRDRSWSSAPGPDRLFAETSPPAE